MNKSKFKLSIIIVLVLAFSYYVISFFSTFHFYAAGSYPYAETYYLNYSEEKIIKAIDKLNLKNTDLKDNDSSDYWHNIYFDLEDKKIHSWTRSFGENETNIAFVAVKNKNEKWQLVNQDLSLFENILIKREFEKMVVERLKIELKK
ncbi:hypothetical protein K5V07_01950 [Flavobacterium sp. CHNK8]|uniref:hypothetical protein n=1 Tax=Flavobacterium sp. CHNK8 TaxID=2871165 RepID=UPI001C8D0796|nr:hypothetical protein [Flavobacterium sp. CHNK8]QZK89319.1 hypothetical protein K5V07_01950 [Flavobacterium sp. CHNK8]